MNGHLDVTCVTRSTTAARYKDLYTSLYIDSGTWGTHEVNGGVEAATERCKMKIVRKPLQHSVLQQTINDDMTYTGLRGPKGRISEILCHANSIPKTQLHTLRPHPLHPKAILVFGL